MELLLIWKHSLIIQAYMVTVYLMHNSQATAMHFMILCFELELAEIVPTLLLQTSLLMSPIAILLLPYSTPQQQWREMW